MIQYALDADPAVPIVMDFDDVDSRWWVRQARERSFRGANFYRTEAARLRLAEAAIARRAARSHRVRARRPPARWIMPAGPAPVDHPDGVDVEYFIPARAPARSARGALPEPAESDRQMVARRRVLPARRRPPFAGGIPAARFLVVGGELAPSAAGSRASRAWRCTRAIADIRPASHRRDDRAWSAPRRGR